MKKRMKISTRLSTLSTMMSVLFLFGCVENSDQSKQISAVGTTKPMAEAQIKEVLINNTIYSVNPKWKFNEAEYYQSDGIVKFKDWDDKKMNDMGSAKWYVNEIKQLCKESLSDKSKGPRCFSVYSGGSKDEIVMKLESGKKSKSYPDGMYHKTLIPGNKYDL